MSQSETVPYAVPMNPAKKGLLDRIGLRLIIILAIIAIAGIFVGYPLVMFLSSGGIRHTAAGEVVDLKTLGFFQMDPKSGTINDVPPRFRALDGKTVILEGFMTGGNGVYDSRDFQFVYNIQNCCFNGPPLAQERVFVHVADANGVELIRNCARISGVLHVKVEKDNGAVISVFKLDMIKVEPL